MNKLLAILAIGICCFGSDVSRGQIALEFTGESANGFNSNLTLGWSFTVNETVVVDGLGFFDDFTSGGVGLQNPHTVGLWAGNQEASLLAEVVVDNDSNPVESVAAEGRWLFQDVEPRVLTPGEYVIGGHTPPCSGGACDRYRFFVTASSIPEITYGVALTRQGYGRPSSPVDSNDGYFGPNFRIRPFSTISPDTYTVLRGLHITGNVGDVATSDDKYLEFNPGFTLNSSEHPVWLVFDANTTASPDRFGLLFESSASTPSIETTLECWNWNTNEYEVVASEAESFNNDRVRYVELTPSLADFLHTPSGNVRSRMGWRANGFLLSYPWEVRIDQLVWMSF